MRKILRNLFVITCIIITSCASFSKEGFKDKHTIINTENLELINGKYGLKPIKKIHEDWNFIVNRNSYYLISEGAFKNFGKKDSINKNHNAFLKLKIINSDTLNVGLMINNKLVKERKLEIEIRKGMIVILEKNIKCEKIPYLYGGCENEKRRIGLTPEKNLISNNAYWAEGANFLILGSSIKGNLSYEFERIR